MPNLTDNEIREKLISIYKDIEKTGKHFFVVFNPTPENKDSDVLVITHGLPIGDLLILCGGLLNGNSTQIG